MELCYLFKLFIAKGRRVLQSGVRKYSIKQQQNYLSCDSFILSCSSRSINRNVFIACTTVWVFHNRSWKWSTRSKWNEVAEGFLMFTPTQTDVRQWFLLHKTLIQSQVQMVNYIFLLKSVCHVISRELCCKKLMLQKLDLFTASEAWQTI